MDPGRTQSARGLEALFSPSSVAVIGASSKPDSVGGLILRNIVQGGFKGPVFPVHPSESEVQGLRAFPSVTALPGPVDLAVVAVPAARVCAVAEECGAKGVHGLVVVSAGFRETGPEGARREEELCAILHRHGMRMVGPNCLGIQNASAAVRLNATFGPASLRPGGAAVLAQSGALGLAILEHAAETGLGVARFASMGNKADVSSNDLLLLWEADPEVRQILLYLESFGNPRNFVRIAGRVAQRKPILAVKSGRSERGAQAARSHTAALAESDLVVDMLLASCGVVRAQTVEDLFDAAAAFALQPLPAGPRLAIVTNSGGPAIMAVDALEAAGLKAADLLPSTLERLRPVVAAQASLANPLDLLASGGPPQYRACIAALAQDPGVDGILAIFTAVFDSGEATAKAIAEAAQAAGKPVLAVFFGQGASSAGARALAAGGVPAYTFPESAVRALGAMHRLSVFRRRDPGRLPSPNADRSKAQALLASGRLRRGGWLPQAAALRLLACYGIPVAPFSEVHTAAEAAQAAATLGFPVVLKGEAAGLVHKSEAGAVEVGLADGPQVLAAFARMDARMRAAGFHMESSLVMRHTAGVEVFAGATQDPKFGPVVAFGLGGIHAEVLKDVAFRLAPVSDLEAELLVRAIRAFPILDGARGTPPRDLKAAADLVFRVGAMAADLPKLAELDVNPVRLGAEGQGAVAVDARARVASS